MEVDKQVILPFTLHILLVMGCVNTFSVSMELHATQLKHIKRPCGILKGKGDWAAAGRCSRTSSHCCHLNSLKAIWINAAENLNDKV